MCTTCGCGSDEVVVTDPDQSPYTRASMILVPGDTPGVKRLRNIPTLSGEHDKFGYGHAEIIYDNVRVPKENLIGQRGQGFPHPHHGREDPHGITPQGLILVSSAQGAGPACCPSFVPDRKNTMKAEVSSWA